MKFIKSKYSKSKLILRANNTDLQERWVVQKSFDIKAGDSKLRRTNLVICEDQFMERTVLAKTVEYDDNALGKVETIEIRRRALEAQVDILNAVASNMLPEPLDFFLTNNDYDDFKNDAVRLKDKEPVLILDYIPGTVLSKKLLNSAFSRFENEQKYNVNDEEQNLPESKEDGNTRENQLVKTVNNVNYSAVMRLIGDILTFEMDLYEKGYAYTSLSPDHIVILGDNKPRFIGLGRICKIENDRYDVNHINFGRHLKGYGAPEFNSSELMFGINESVRGAIAYNLGVLIACLMLNKTEFLETELYNGSYDYENSTKDREAIQTIHERERVKKVEGEEVVIKYGTGWTIDKLICKLTDKNPKNRLTDFKKILFELAVISGDATRERKNKEPIHYGYIDTLFLEKEFPIGFVESGWDSYYVPINYIKHPPKWVEGERVAFTLKEITSGSRKGEYVVKDFIVPAPKKPRTAKVFPKFVPKQEPIMQPVKPKPKPKPQVISAPQPKPTVIPQPQSQPQPAKKGFFARLFGL